MNTKSNNNFYVDVVNDEINKIDFVKKEINLIYQPTLYENENESSNDFPQIYKTLYHDLKSIQLNKKIVVFSSDSYVIVPTIRAFTEINSVREESSTGTTFKSDLRIIYITNNIFINLLTQSKNLEKSILSNIFGFTKSFDSHCLNINPEQVTIAGYCEKDLDEETEILINKLNFAKKIPLNNNFISLLEEHISDINSLNCKVLISIDLSILDINDYVGIKKMCGKSGIEFNIFTKIQEILKKLLNVCCVTITGYDFRYFKESQNLDRIKSKASAPIANILSTLCNEATSNINIMNEHTKFLIMRSENDIFPGWHILKGVPVSLRNHIIKMMEENDQDIICITEQDDEGNDITFMYSTTTLHEQRDKSYNNNIKIEDKILFSDDKMAAMFELINKFSF